MAFRTPFFAVAALATLTSLRVSAASDEPILDRPFPTPQLVGWRNMTWKYQGPWLPEGSRFNLVQSPEVQKELDLTDEAKKKLFVGRLPAIDKKIENLKIDVFMRWRPERYAELRESGIVRLSRLERELDRALLEILTIDQRRRLDEIALQQAGPLFVAKPDGARLLGLGFPQVERIQAIMAEAEASIESVAKARLGPPVEPTVFDGNLTDEQRGRLLAAQERRKAREKITYQEEAKAIVAVRRVLTDRQRARYRQLLGKPFDLRRLTLTYYEATQHQTNRAENRPVSNSVPSPNGINPSQ